MPGFELIQTQIQTHKLVHHAPRDVFRTWSGLDREATLPPSLLTLERDEGMEAVYQKYEKDKPKYTQVRSFCGLIQTPEELADFWRYCRTTQDMNDGRRVPMCLFYPSCAGEAGANEEGSPEAIDRSKERISLIAPAPSVYQKAAVHFSIMRRSLDEMGIHYQEDMMALAERHGVRAEYYDNGRDDRFFPNLIESLRDEFPDWMLELPPVFAVADKYGSDPEQYSRLRHLGAITREQLEALLGFLSGRFPLEHLQEGAQPYCYPSSADERLVSVNIPSPREHDTFVNVSIPLDVIGSIESFTRECVARLIDMMVAPGSRPLPLGEFPEGGVYPASINDLAKSFNIDVRALWLLLKDSDDIKGACDGLMRAVIFDVLKTSEIIPFLQASDNAPRLTVCLKEAREFSLRDVLVKKITSLSKEASVAGPMLQRLEMILEIIKKSGTSIGHRSMIDMPLIFEQVRKWNPRIPDGKIFMFLKQYILDVGSDAAFDQVNPSLIMPESSEELYLALRDICTQAVIAAFESVRGDS